MYITAFSSYFTKLLSYFSWTCSCQSLPDGIIEEDLVEKADDFEQVIVVAVVEIVFVVEIAVVVGKLFAGAWALAAAVVVAVGVAAAVVVQTAVAAAAVVLETELVVLD